MSNAVVAAEKWLYTVLSGSAALTTIVSTRIYSELAPPSSVYPLVFYSLSAGADNLLTLQAYRIWSPLVYAVRLINKVESIVPLEAGAAAIETALSRSSGSNASGVVCACVYEAPFKMVEISKDGFTLCHLGGLYRLYVQ